MAYAQIDRIIDAGLSTLNLLLAEIDLDVEIAALLEIVPHVRHAFGKQVCIHGAFFINRQVIAQGFLRHFDSGPGRLHFHDRPGVQHDIRDTQWRTFGGHLAVGSDAAQCDGGEEMIGFLEFELNPVDAAARAILLDAAKARHQKTVPVRGLDDCLSAQNRGIASNCRCRVMGALAHTERKNNAHLLIIPVVFQTVRDRRDKVAVINEQLPDFLFGGRHLREVKRLAKANIGDAQNLSGGRRFAKHRRQFRRVRKTSCWS